MGHWGTGISSNDTYADIYEQFIDLYNEGLFPSEITETLVRNNQETIGIYEDAPNFWYAIAKAQWECSELQSDVLKRVESYVQTGEDLRIWKHLGATRADLNSREKALNKFLAKLQTEKLKARKRKKKKYFDSLFKKGDCLVYKMVNGNYGGAFVLTEERQTETGTNYIAITTIDSPAKPNLDDFRKGEVFMRRAEEYRFSEPGVLEIDGVDQPQIGGFYAMSFDIDKVEIEAIGRLPVYKEYQVRRIVGFGWNVLRSLVPHRVEYEAKNGKPTSRLFLKEWTQRQWRFPLLRFFNR